MSPGSGWGSEWGSNFGAGGVIYLTGLIPDDGGVIPSDNSIRFTVGVQGGLIDITSVQISVNSQLAFTGFSPLGGEITNATNNGLGLIRVTTSLANGLITGQSVNVVGVFGVPADGEWIVTVVDGSHFDLTGSTFSGAYTGGGLVSFPPAFAADFLSSSYAYSAPDNGFSFVILGTIVYPSLVAVTVVANTTDGATSVNSYQVVAPQQPNYLPTPFNVEFGIVPIARFTGEIQSGILAGSMGQVFFSPALPVANTGSQIDLDSIETVVKASDSYIPQAVGSNNRPWLWGPPPVAPPDRAYPPQYSTLSYTPVWNSWNGSPTTAPFVMLMTTQAVVSGLLTSFPSGATTVVLY